MSQATNPINANMPMVTGTTAAPSASDPTTAGAIATTNTGNNLTTSSTFSSMADFKRKAPKVYNAMMQGIAMNIVSQMQQQENEEIQLIKQGEENPY